MVALSYEHIQKISKKHIQHCGARYTPNLDGDSPNIEIESLLQTFDSFCYLPNYFERIRKAQENYKDEIKYSKWERCFKGLKKTPQSYLSDIYVPYEYTFPHAVNAFVLNHGKYIKFLLKKSYDYQRELFSAENRIGKGYSTSGDLDEYHIRKIISKLNELNQLVHNEPFGSVNKQILLLKGTWGSGKTHYLCDYCLRMFDMNKLCLFSVSGQIKPLMSPLESLVSQFTKENGGDFLKELNEEGKRLNYRVPIIVDAINEGDLKWWQKNLTKIAREISTYSHICLIISCRSPYEEKILNNQNKNRIFSVLHPEFEDLEFDAQKEFFDYYSIPNFNFPLLSEEFRKPLFLKIFCESASKWPRKFNDVTSGQKSMTHMLELYTEARTVDLLEGVDMTTPYTDENKKIIWNFYKGGKGYDGLAPLMASLGKDYLKANDVYLLAEKYFSVDRQRVKSLVKSLVQYGLLIDDYIYDWESNSYIDVYRFPYQKFSDHLIARYLLDNYLNTSSINTIRYSFYSHRPLGKVFSFDEHGYEYQHPNIAEALMLEFPERVKKKRFIKNRELIFYIPKSKALISPSYQLFLSGLEWRSKSSFSIGTNAIINQLLRMKSGYQRDTYFTLLSLATRTNHPYSSIHLYQHLQKMNMCERDEKWNTIISQGCKITVPFRLCEWVETYADQMNKETADNLVVFGSLFLGTVDRDLRDKVTKSLYMIGLKEPLALFDHLYTVFDFNDPYVRERMMASCFGVLMAKWSDPVFIDNDAFKESVKKLAKFSYTEVLHKSGKYSSSHALLREYCWGILKLSEKMNCFPSISSNSYKDAFNENEHICPDIFPSKIDGRSISRTDFRYHMDFENYTLGRLVRDRAPYDNLSVEYQLVRDQVKWRMAKLGYLNKKFEPIEESLKSFLLGNEARMRGKTDYGGKIDAFSKKYAWISYYELAGVRGSQGLTSSYNYRDDVDIDPSFPSDISEIEVDLNNASIEKHIKFFDPFLWLTDNKATLDLSPVLELSNINGHHGKWILISAFISRELKPLSIYTRVSGYFYKKTDLQKLLFNFYKTDTSLFDLEDTPELIYTFLGEIPWSDAYSDVSDIGAIGKTSPYKIKAFSNSKNETELERINNMYAWESNLSSENTFNGQYFPTKFISEVLKLKNIDNSNSLYDEHNRMACTTVRFKSGKQDSKFRGSTGFYLREDLLEKYLEETNQEFIRLTQGEREFTYPEYEKYQDAYDRLLDQRDRVRNKDVILTSSLMNRCLLAAHKMISVLCTPLIIKYNSYKRRKMDRVFRELLMRE